MKQVAGIWLPDTDTHFADALANSEAMYGAASYQLNKIRAALDVCSSDRRRLALDVGAHVGLWSRVLAREFDKVWAFEPMPALVECFEANLRGLRNVVLNRFALADHVGEGKMLSVSGNSGNARVDEAGDTDVIFERMDDLGIFRIDFLKVDCEGFEAFVLRGGEQTIRRDKPIVVVEQKKGHASRYGLDDKEACEILRDWRAEQVWEISGDHCFRFR